MEKIHRTVIIDDEKLAVKRLQRLLAEFCPPVELVGEAYNGKEGLKLISDLKPDLVFLDIEMPLMNGFEMLGHLAHMPVIVFTTAFDEYAVKAFEQNSIDYLLKPIEKERLALTVKKIKNLQRGHAFDETLLLQLAGKLQPKKEMLSLPVKSGDRVLLLRLEDILYFGAEDKYVNVYTADQKKYLSDYSLSLLESKLPADFLRISKSAVINTRQVREIRKYFNGRYIIVMNDGARTQLTSGNTYQAAVKPLTEI